MIKMLKKLCLIFIRLYQIMLSPLLSGHCRFFPTCSQYVLEAIETYGIVRGILMGLKRILKCQPFCQGGIDPVVSKDECRKMLKKNY